MQTDYATTLEFSLAHQDSLSWSRTDDTGKSTGELEAYGPAYIILEVEGHTVELIFDYERPCQSVTVATDAKVSIVEGPAKVGYDDVY